jgi:hypothetical protein
VRHFGRALETLRAVTRWPAGRRIKTRMPRRRRYAFLNAPPVRSVEAQWTGSARAAHPARGLMGGVRALFLGSGLDRGAAGRGRMGGR